MSIYKKLFEAKKEIGKISKDSKNPFFKSNYLSLNGLIDAVEVVLLNNDLVLLQPIRDGFVTTQIVEIESGTSVESSIALPNIQDPQKLGSAITYYRRYTLQSLLGLQAEDDDGNKASKPVNYTRQIAMLKACKTLDELKQKYSSLTPLEQKATLKTKDGLKLILK